MTDKTLGAYQRHEAHDAAHDIDWQAVAEQHEDTIQALLAERDEADARAKRYAATIDEQRALITDLRAAQPRPFTPDDISGPMIERARDTFADLQQQGRPRWMCIEGALRAALTPPPARPEGAEEIEAWLDGMPESIRLDGDEHQRLFANHLAHMGFRIPAVMEEGR